MLKKAVQQGRSERRGEKRYKPALRVGRSPLEWILANGKAPTVLPISETRRASKRSENAAWEGARLGAPRLGG
jgi:hypothetical protein